MLRARDGFGVHLAASLIRLLVDRVDNALAVLRTHVDRLTIVQTRVRATTR